MVDYNSAVSSHFYVADQVYIVGSIQTEREFECENNEATSYISIVIHNASLVNNQALISYSILTYVSNVYFYNII